MDPCPHTPAPIADGPCVDCVRAAPRAPTWQAEFAEAMADAVRARRRGDLVFGTLPAGRREERS